MQGQVRAALIKVVQRDITGPDQEPSMILTTAVDRVEVHILVDNVTDSLSTVPSHVENEWSYL